MESKATKKVFVRLYQVNKQGVENFSFKRSIEIKSSNTQVDSLLNTAVGYFADCIGNFVRKEYELAANGFASNFRKSSKTYFEVEGVMCNDDYVITDNLMVELKPSVLKKVANMESNNMLIESCKHLMLDLQAYKVIEIN